MTLGFMEWTPVAGVGIVSLFEGKSFFDPGIALIFLLCLLFAGAVFTWAAAFRKRRRPPDYRRHHTPVTAGNHPEKTKMGRWFPRRRRRRRRRERSRNPTLAETGGLPPMRAGKPPETGA